ncbi:hypothetical protein EI546_03590 [Aequorivita sp. H23M31]|uniref:Uncharacterized protein n=1 Tax=Aequorivita ciconiae TaxID=2494375 RepID=A0A410G0S2_9FLAO|nr:DUF6090 family protein [Aequorivita sp. H23M31]QAA80867.1 hypothetical protein EI546_03590 [Aequorivita sp. H23M31]
MKRIRIGNWRKQGFEFLLIFIAVISAFALNNWNENRKTEDSENKILTAIANGLEKDIDDIRSNKRGHKKGISACVYFRKLLTNQEVNPDSLLVQYENLTRTFISIQNVAGYETLKSQGLGLVSDDSLRLQIISLYEYDFNALRKLEEEYSELQFQKNYFNEINTVLAPNFEFDENGKPSGIALPLEISENQKKILLVYLSKIEENRNFILTFYSDIETKIESVRKNITKEI